MLRLEEIEQRSPVLRTIQAMREGPDVIVQAFLGLDRWRGRADILLKVNRPSDLGDWSYEVIDTKLAQETRAGTILQLCLYSNIVGEFQGTPPEFMHVVAPGHAFQPETFRVDDFMAYYRLVQQNLVGAADSYSPDSPGTYPEPVPQCDICRWWSHCDRRWREDDHLSLVAGLSKLQANELRARRIGTLEALAGLEMPLEPRPGRGAPDGYLRVREQARIQLEGRERQEPVYELLPSEQGQGFQRLPESSPGDIFFDIEGDHFVEGGGLEYLFGWVVLDDQQSPQYAVSWGFDRPAEKNMFEAFVDFVLDRWSRYPDLHIYHFAHYEPSTLKRLMGRYASREEEVDRMLRAGLFVDLHAVVKQSVRASVERYSIKDLESFYDYTRQLSLREASKNIRLLERALELDQLDSVPEEICRAVEEYNEDDCISTLRLRDWLERLRSDLVQKEGPIPRPELQSGDPSDVVDERTRRVHRLMEKLAGDVSDERSGRNEEQQARWLLAQMLELHRREMKAPWWEYFRLLDLTEEELLDEKAALSGLEFVETVGEEKIPVHRYRYPRQDSGIRKRDDLRTGDGEAFGKVQGTDLVARTIDIKKRGDTADKHPRAVFVHSIVRKQELSDSLFRLGEWVARNGVDAPGPRRAARDLLLRHQPRLAGDASLNREGRHEDTLTAGRRLGKLLDGGVLPIQGPPGAGKTYTGARMICELVREGKKVGITAVSHKVIRKLLDDTIEAAREQHLAVSCIQKPKGKPSEDQGGVREVRDNKHVLEALDEDEAQVAGGTAWLWSRPEFFESVDVLFVDEAGQMSLADTLAAAQAAKSLVLLGDPQQLEQPQQGSHPEGTDVSALQHVLGEERTIASDQGLFLAETWRLHPSIAAFTSEQFYGGRLRSRPELERQTIVGPTPFAGSGLWFVPVEHEGNQSSSPEEVEAVRSVLDSILLEGAEWIDSKGLGRPLTLDEFLIVAPYNAQVSDLGERIRGARVGTVDKFQGQEAPIVVYSMTTSSPEEAPRGMEFLYSLNRLNVATSRARCACILVASPALFHPDCRTPRLMELANAFCRYVELARVARISSGSLTSRPQPGNGPGGGTDHCDSDSCDAPDRPSFRQECRE